MDAQLDLAGSKLGELIAVYKDHPATLNHYFQENVTALQRARREPLIEARLREIFSERRSVDETNIPLLMSALQLKDTPDMNRQAAEKVLDHMNAFYKVCAPRSSALLILTTGQDGHESFPGRCPKPRDSTDHRQPSTAHVQSGVGVRHGIRSGGEDRLGV